MNKEKELELYEILDTAIKALQYYEVSKDSETAKRALNKIEAIKEKGKSK